MACRSRLALCLVPLAMLVSAGAACSRTDRLNARCLSGDAARCAELGEMYATGAGGVPLDMARAAEMYERACAGGATDVCNTLGEIYEKSGTFDGGDTRAVQMYEKACNGGSSAGCLNLGLHFAAREAYQQAMALYEKSCSGGWAAGCYQLALSHRNGEGTPKDVVKAIALFREACDGEHLDGCTSAAELLAAGEGVPRDVVAASSLYARAIALLDQGCEAGVERDCAERGRLQTRAAILAQQPPDGKQPTAPR